MSREEKVQTAGLVSASGPALIPTHVDVRASAANIFRRLSLAINMQKTR